jgi:hypothetical protein
MLPSNINALSILNGYRIDFIEVSAEAADAIMIQIYGIARIQQGYEY